MKYLIASLFFIILFTFASAQIPSVKSQSGNFYTIQLGTFDPAVKQADLAMLSTEAQYLLPSGGNSWDMWKQIRRPAPNALFRPINMPPRQANQLFLDKFNELYELYRASLRATTA